MSVWYGFKSSLRDHPGLAREVEQAAGVHHGAHVAEGFEGKGLAGGLHGDSALVEVHRHHVAGFQRVAEALGDFARVQFAGGHGIAEENAGEAFREHDAATRRAEGDGRVFARTAAAEIFPGHDDGIAAVKLAGFDEAVGVERFRQAGERVAAEFLVFVGDRRHEVQELRGNDLIRVNVITHDIDGAGKDRFRHGSNLPLARAVFNQISMAGGLPDGGCGGETAGGAAGGAAGWARFRKAMTAATQAVHVGKSARTGNSSTMNVGSSRM